MYIKESKKVINFFEKNKFYCPACKLTHTGRNSYLIFNYLYMYEKMHKKSYFNKAYDLAKSTMDNLRKDKNNNIVFLSYSKDKKQKNDSTNIINSGISTDSISHFLFFCQENKINIREHDEWIEKLQFHIDNYLKKSVQQKTCLNQKAWGLTGIASFYNLTKDENLKCFISSIIDEIFSYQNDDGSFDYIINSKELSSFFSLYYFPRLLTFLVYSMNYIDYNVYEEQLKKSVILLIDCYDNNCNKILALESKNWFFTASYEVESLVYDIYFIKYLERTYGYDFLDILEKQITFYKKHIYPKGVVSNIENKPNLFCEFIDNSDFVWLLKSEKIIENFQYKKNIYTQQNRKYENIGFEVKFYEKNKSIKVYKSEGFSSFWGLIKGLEVIVFKDEIKTSLPIISYEYVINPNIIESLKNFKNIFATSKDNMKYKKYRKLYLINRFIKFVKYDFLKIN